MPPEADQQTFPPFARRAAAVAEIEAEQELITRALEIAKIIYFVFPTPGSAWPTDQNGKLPKYLKGILHAAKRSHSPARSDPAHLMH